MGAFHVTEKGTPTGESCVLGTGVATRVASPALVVLSLLEDILEHFPTTIAAS